MVQGHGSSAGHDESFRLWSLTKRCERLLKLNTAGTRNTTTSFTAADPRLAELVSMKVMREGRWFAVMNRRGLHDKPRQQHVAELKYDRPVLTASIRPGQEQ